MFWGTFTNKVDAKRRVSVPAPYRQELEKEKFNGLFCFPSLTGPCIEGAGQVYFYKLLDLIRQRDPFDELRLAYEVSIVGDTMQLYFDSEGRITLTGIFSKHAEIDDSMTFVGTGDRIMMWNPKVYEPHHLNQRRIATEKREQLHGFRQAGQSMRESFET